MCPSRVTQVLHSAALSAGQYSMCDIQSRVDWGCLGVQHEQEVSGPTSLSISHSLTRSVYLCIVIVQIGSHKFCTVLH